jgi:hypothetical protein
MGFGETIVLGAVIGLSIGLSIFLDRLILKRL